MANTAPDELVARYLAHVRFEKGLAQRTCDLYQLDLMRLCKTATCVAGWRRCTARVAVAGASP
jgi:site-specific recombinase XerC